MHRRPSCLRRHFARALPALALAALATACYATTPYHSTPAGAANTSPRPERVLVQVSPSTRLLFRSAAGDTIRSNASGLTGTVAEVRGDTLVLRDPKMNGAPLRFTSPVSGAAVEATTVLIVPENHATLATRRLEGGRTALLVLGATVVTLGILAAIATTEISNGY